MEGALRRIQTDAAAAKQQFAAFCSGRDEQDRRIFTAIAAENCLGASVLSKLGASEPQLTQWLKEGALRSSGQVRPLSIAAAGPTEPAYALTPMLRQLILRDAQGRGLLGPLTLQLEVLLKSRSVAGLQRKLQAGSLIFRPGERQVVSREVSEALRDSILKPFDPEWMCQTWKARTTAIVHHVLLTSLTELTECRELLEWARLSPECRADTQLCEVMACHALHQCDPDLALELAKPLAVATRLGLGAIARLQAGEVDLAFELWQQCLRFSSGKYPPLHPLCAVLALLGISLERSEPAAAAAAVGHNNFDPAKWLAPNGSDEASKRIGRALRNLVRHRDESEAGLRRLDAHQLGPEAPAFETLICGLTVQAYVDHDSTRAAWADCLTRRAAAWLETGYLWLGRQALVVACSLDRLQMQHCLQDIKCELPMSEAGLTIQKGDLASLIKKREPWESSLIALNRITNAIGQAATQYRIEWFVDPVSGTISRPGLQNYQPTQGWHLIRRLSLIEACAFTDQVPPEDARILARVAELQGQDADLHLQIFEALIGHPRVFDGALGGKKLAIVRSECRVETHDEVGSIRVGVRPTGLGPGLNLVTEADDRLSVIFVSAEMQQIVNAMQRDLVIPQIEAAQVISLLGRLGDTVAVQSNYLEGEETVSADTTPTLRIAPLAGAWILELGVRPFGAEGRFFTLGTGPAILNSTRAGRRLRAQRNFNEESVRLSQIVEKCPTLLRSANEAELDKNAQRWIFGQDQIFDLLVELRESGLNFHIDWPEKTGIRLSSSISIGGLRGALRSKKGWYILSGSVELDRVTAVSLAELLRMPFVSRGRFLRLPSGDYAQVDEKIRQLLLALALSKVEKGTQGAVQVPLARLAQVRATLEGATIEVDSETRAALVVQTEISHRKYELPLGLNAELRPYQVEGFEWLCRLSELGLGACLADDMGLGKTLQIIAFLLTRPLGSTHLVVAPTSVCTNWEREITRFAPGLCARQYDTKISLLEQLAQLRADWVASASSVPTAATSLASSVIDETAAIALSVVLVISYAQLSETTHSMNEFAWDTLVTDEAQYIKNPKTQRAQAILRLQAQHKIAATGTPVENHLGDVWGIFRFINPELLGRWSAFQTHFVNPIERDDDDLKRENLRQILRPYILRRRKDQVLAELPERTIIRHEVRLGEQEAMRYAYLRRQIHDKLRTPAGKRGNKLEILAEINRLRRYCCHPRLVFPDAPDDSPKLRALIPLAQELAENGHRALVFSQYVDCLAKVRERLDEHNLNYEYLDGSTPKADRQGAVDRFQEGNTPLFLISLKAGGLGLNLTAADYVIHLDPWWNPAVGAQATDRAHRLGQTRPVTVYEFVTRDTIEADIMRLHESKRDLADLLLKESEKVGDLKQVELLDWLSQSLEKRQDSGLSL